MILWFLTACLSPEIDYGESCITINDGQCDELNGCPLGSDSQDCDAACSQTPWPQEIEGACAHDMSSMEPLSQTKPGAGSEGVGGQTGSYDGIVTVRGAYESDLVDRHFRIYVPRRYDPAMPTPVLFVLGGFTVDMYWLAEFTEMNRLADRENVIIVYGHPEWRDFNGTDLFAWYSYEQAYQGDWIDNPDIAYMEAIADQVKGLYNIDTDRIYVSGHSRGGALSIIAAFERPDLFAGYCAQAGFVTANNYLQRIRELAAVQITPGVLIHGDDDPDVGISESYHLSDALTESNWTYTDDWLFMVVENATHEWQSQYNQIMWDWLWNHPKNEISP